jgi:peptidoglycan/LPS O-acetylase OafA/YrhL
VSDNLASKPTRLPSLTSLRWFAALMVFVTHCEPFIRASSLKPAFERVGVHGGLGVSFFFVLSGFVLTWTYRETDTGMRFFRRRFARIAPAYWTSIAAALLVFATVEHSLTTSRIARSAFAAVFLQSWVPDERVYLAGNPVGWTLSVEAFFYAMFPILIVVLVAMGRRRLLVVVAVLAVLVCVVLPLAIHPSSGSDGAATWALKIFPAVRILEFVIGICLALLLRGGARLSHPFTGVWSAAGLVVVAFVAAGWVPVYFAIAAITLVPFALLIFVSAQRDHEGGSGLLHQPWLIRLGEWSFCFYLIHQLVVRVLVITFTPEGLWTGLLMAAAALIASIAAAGLMFTFIERPMERRLRGKQEPRPESYQRL